MTGTATLAHPDRLTLGGTAAPALDVELAVEQLASLLADTHGDQLEALESVARAARRLARAQRLQDWHEEERPVPAMGAWSLDNGTMIVLGEN